MTDDEREERAIWKLGEAGYVVRRDTAGRYIVRARGQDDDYATFTSIANLAALADAIYASHWTSTKITPSA